MHFILTLLGYFYKKLSYAFKLKKSMYQQEKNVQQEDKTLWMGIVIVTVLEVVFWLLFYWIHLKIRA